MAISIINSFVKIISSFILLPAGSAEDFIKQFLERTNGDPKLTIVYLIFFGLGTYFSLKNKKKFTVFLNFLFILPPLILFFFRPKGFGFDIRYVSFILIPCFLLIASGIVNIFKKDKFLVLTLAIIIYFSVKPLNYYFNHSIEDWKGAADFITKSAQRGGFYSSRNTD